MSLGDIFHVLVSLLGFYHHLIRKNTSVKRRGEVGQSANSRLGQQGPRRRPARSGLGRLLRLRRTERVLGAQTDLGVLVLDLQCF